MIIYTVWTKILKKILFAIKKVQNRDTLYKRSTTILLQNGKKNKLKLIFKYIF